VKLISDAQDEAERIGLLERVRVTEPCSELCYCAEMRTLDRILSAIESQPEEE
jgi:hypothetical protein